MKRWVHASSEWDLGWSKRSDERGNAYFVLRFPTGSATVTKKSNGLWNAEISWRNGDNRHSVGMDDEFDAMDWAQKIIHEVATDNKQKVTSVTEPSGYELGKAIDEGRKRINERFAPFVIKNLYRSGTTLNSCGYLIQLPEANKEWVLYHNEYEWPKYYSLYGPFGIGEIDYADSHFNHLKGEPIENKKFKWLDDTISYLWTEEDIEASTDVMASRKIDLFKDNLDWMVGLHWVSDWHDFTITEVDNSLGICLVKEEWIAEDVGTDCENTEAYRILTDDNGHLYISSKKYPQYSKFYANSALNYRDLVPKELDELDFLDDDSEEADDGYDDYDEDDYTPSATRGDYSPSNPWDAPGMSIHDFI